MCVCANKARRVFGSCAGSPATKSFACLQMCRQSVIQSLRAGYAKAAVASAWQTNKYHLDAAVQGLSFSALLVSTKVMCRHFAVCAYAMSFDTQRASQRLAAAETAQDTHKLTRSSIDPWSAPLLPISTRSLGTHAQHPLERIYCIKREKQGERGAQAAQRISSAQVQPELWPG